MYERFTDRARRTMQLANQEAQKLNHEYIGTEHMLLGILRDDNTATSVLERLGVRRSQLQEMMYDVLLAGPDMMAIGKLPQTPRAKAAIELAIQFAREWNHNYVGTEHILLGLFVDGSMTKQLMEKLGLTVEKVKSEIVSLLGMKPVDDPAPKVDELKEFKLRIKGLLDANSIHPFTPEVVLVRKSIWSALQELVKE